MEAGTTVIRCLAFVDAPCLTASEWAAWVQAVGAVLAIIVAIWLARRGEASARKLLADERTRQSSIAIRLIAARAAGLAEEAKLKASWLREAGAPKDLGNPDSREARATAADRLRLGSIEHFGSDVRMVLTFVNERDGDLVSGCWGAALAYDQLIDTLLDTFDGGSFAPYFRQNMEAVLTQKLGLVAAAAEALTTSLTSGTGGRTQVSR